MRLKVHCSVEFAIQVRLATSEPSHSPTVMHKYFYPTSGCY